MFYSSISDFSKGDDLFLCFALIIALRDKLILTPNTKVKFLAHLSNAYSFENFNGYAKNYRFADAVSRLENDSDNGKCSYVIDIFSEFIEELYCHDNVDDQTNTINMFDYIEQNILVFSDIGYVAIRYISHCKSDFSERFPNYRINNDKSPKDDADHNFTELGLTENQKKFVATKNLKEQYELTDIEAFVEKASKLYYDENTKFYQTYTVIQFLYFHAEQYDNAHYCSKRKS